MSLTDMPRTLVEGHESAMDPGRRRLLGAHYTPEALAGRLVALAFDELGRVPAAVLDPSCGAGSILLAAADALLAMGLRAEEVPARLIGADIDPASLEAARRAFDSWAENHSVRGTAGPRFVLHDATTSTEPPGLVDVVVGNPPFSSPLHHATTRSPRESSGPYTDSSAHHLLAAVKAADPGTVVCMLQPQSVLAARDAAPVRAELAHRAELVGMWITDDQPFDADVQVCAPVLRRVERRDTAGGGEEPRRCRVRVHWRNDPPRVSLIDPAGTWSPLLADSLGVPAAPEPPYPSSPLRELAKCTAGFRDEFYALAEASREQSDAGAAGGGQLARLVTSGMIDPARLDWGTQPRRLAGERIVRPVVDLDELAVVSAAVARWTRTRMVPKVLVASQTRILEPAIDLDGDCVPVTPVVSVEPSPEPVGPRARLSLEATAGLLAAPSTSARVAAASLGTGRSTGSLRITAKALSSLPVPEDPGARERLEQAWRSLEKAVGAGGHPGTSGAELDAAMGTEDPTVLAWWTERVERRIRRS